jgi:hypothetical protein
VGLLWVVLGFVIGLAVAAAGVVVVVVAVVVLFLGSP